MEENLKEISLINLGNDIASGKIVWIVIWQQKVNDFLKIYMQKLQIRDSGDLNFVRVVRVLIHQGPSYFFKKK